MPEGSWVSQLAQLVTLEVALYTMAVLAGATLRFAALDSRPLSMEEGTLAAESYRLALAQPVDKLQQGPIGAFGTALALVLFGWGDGAARALPALFGSLLVAVPYLLRDSLGRVPALLAAYGFAFSPLLLFASRDVGAGAVPLTLAMLFIALAERGLKSPTQPQAYGIALLSAGLLTSGVGGATILVTLALAGLLAHPQLSALLSDLRAAASSPLWRRAGLLFAGSTLAVGTGLGTHLAGVQSVLVDVWSSWLGSLSFSAPRGGILVVIALYELPVLLFGLIQLFRTMFQRRRFDMFLSLWLMLLLLLGMVQQTSATPRVVLPTLPLYLLAARLVADGLPLLKGRGHGWSWNLVALFVTVPVIVAIVLLNRATGSENDIPTPYLFGEATLVVVGSLAFTFLLHSREKLALVWCGVSILSLAFLLHTTVYLNYRMETLDREPIVGSQLSTSLRTAASQAAYFSAYYNQRVTVDPELRSATLWYLRDARDVRYSTDAQDGISIALIRSAQSKLDPSAERRAGLYLPSIEPRDASWRSVWRWLVMRDGLVRPNQRDIIVRAPAGNW